MYPGPIGAILSPLLTGIEDNASLPYASSLCGACYDVCPVKINIPEILVHLRAPHTETYAEEHRVPSAEASAMTAAAWVMSNPKRWTLCAAQRATRPSARPQARRDWRGAIASGKAVDRCPRLCAAAEADVPRLVGC